MGVVSLFFFSRSLSSSGSICHIIYFYVKDKVFLKLNSASVDDKNEKNEVTSLSELYFK
jgi:hypothetical protein